MHSRKKIVVIGSSNTDMIVKSERLPGPGETVIGERFLMTNGGKGANQAVAAARLGADVVFVTKTGNDMFRERTISSYTHDGIDTSFAFCDPDTPSGIALITVDARGENCITVAPGANFTLTVKEIELAREAIADAAIVLMQLEIPMEVIEYASAVAWENKVPVVLNPAPACCLPESVYSKTSILIPNRSEAELLSGITVRNWEDAERAAVVIKNKGCATVVITLGATGALLYHCGQFTRIPTRKVNAVDATAAGDTFCGAFCLALTEGKGLEEAIEFANRCAGITVSRLGAQSSIPHRNEVDMP